MFGLQRRLEPMDWKRPDVAHLLRPGPGHCARGKVEQEQDSETRGEWGGHDVNMGEAPPEVITQPSGALGWPQAAGLLQVLLCRW